MSATESEGQGGSRGDAAQDGAVHFPLDFMILGAQKAGTSWLHARLREQPGFWLPADKDYEFFSYPGTSPEADFRARFDVAPARPVIIGDACASYFWTTGLSEHNPGFARDLPATIDASLGPQARYIVLLRDPVERAVSAYLHHIAFGSLSARVPLLDAPDVLGLVDIGRYGKHLEAWLDRVGPERLCVLPAPGEVPPAEVLEHAVRFLGGRTMDDRPGVDAPVFEGTPRVRDESGVWVLADAAGMADAPGRRTEFGGRRWVRVVDRDDLEQLETAFQEDGERVGRCLNEERSDLFADTAWLNRTS